MVVFSDELKTLSIDSPKGGKGKMEKTVVLAQEEMLLKGKTLAKLILHPGCEMGFHRHEGDSEFYFILSGSGEYCDNGTNRTVNCGDLCVVNSGEGHGLKNTGDSDMEVIALILYS